MYLAFPIAPDGIIKSNKPGFNGGLMTTILVLVYDCTEAATVPK